MKAENSGKFKNFVIPDETPEEQAFWDALSPEAKQQSLMETLKKLTVAYQKNWDLTDEDWAAMLKISLEETWKIQRGEFWFDGNTPEGTETRDRIACLFQIGGFLCGMFRDPNAEREYIRETQELLDGERTPLELMKSKDFEDMQIFEEYLHQICLVL